MALYAQSAKFLVLHKGISRGQRTNKWQATCKKCGYINDLPPTRLANDRIVCEKCQETEVVNYNNIIEHK